MHFIMGEQRENMEGVGSEGGGWYGSRDPEKVVMGHGKEAMGIYIYIYAWNAMDVGVLRGRS